eukprot:670992-Prorocentrum_minimum.AAC.1
MDERRRTPSRRAWLSARWRCASTAIWHCCMYCRRCATTDWLGCGVGLGLRLAAGTDPVADPGPPLRMWGPPPPLA